ncbi:MAG: DUF892 family protein [Solirubrobacterales bacterium]|nr:DUF892 family protein [Solirubrobacterales bacterium]
MPADIEDQLVKHLTDAHAIEEQALTQMRRAPGIADDPRLAEVFRRHLEETEGHERRVRERLAATTPSHRSSRTSPARPGACR